MAIEQYTSTPIRDANAIRETIRTAKPTIPGMDGGGDLESVQRAPAPAPSTATAEEEKKFNPLSFGEFFQDFDPEALNFLTQKASGSSSSGGTRTSSSGGSGGGGGSVGGGSRDHLKGRVDAIDPDLRAQLEAAVFSDLSDDDESKEAIRQAADFARIEGEEAFERSRSDLVGALFGSGRTEGSLAARQISDAGLDEARFFAGVTQQMWKDLADLDMQEEAKRQNAWATVLGIQSQLDTAVIGANTEITTAGIDARSRVKVANINAAASRDVAGIAASASRYASQNSLLGQIYGIEVGQRQFEADLDYRYEELSVSDKLARDQMEMERRIAKRNRSAARKNAIIGAVGNMLSFTKGIP